MPPLTAICRASALTASLSLGGCMLFEPPPLPDPPLDDPCFAGVTLDQVPAPARGDHPYTWKCEAMARAPMSNALHWFRNAMEYRALTLQNYAEAERQLPAFAQRYKQSGWFVIMDADETLLDNSDYTKEYEACGGGFWQPTWCDWSRARQAKAVPGAVAFTRAVHRSGGFVAVVTNRLAQEDEWTRDNLKALGIEFDLLYLRTDESEKTARWRKAAQDISVVAAKAGRSGTPVPVMWIGDQITDFPQLDASGQIAGAMSQASFNAAQNVAANEFGVRFILLPQPLYSGRDGWTANEKQ